METGIKFVAIRSLSKALRIVGLKQYAWNIEHKSLFWLTNKKSQLMIDIIAEILNGGVVVEFGCGDGTLPLYLPEDGFSKYTGYDISSVAIQMCQKANRNPKISFDTKGMESWEEHDAEKVDTIICEECLYYLDEPSLNRFLNVCCSNLKPDGQIFAAVHSRTKHARTIEQIRNSMNIVKEINQGQRIYMIVRCKTSAATVDGVDVPS